MFNVNLEKELHESVEVKEIPFKQNVITEVTKLLEDKTVEDRKILSQLSPNCTEIQIMNEKSKVYERDELSKKHGEFPIFTLEEIKHLAIKYRLRFLRTKYYQSTFSASSLVKLKNFMQSAKIEKNKWDLEESFYMLAPKSMFKLGEKPAKFVPDPDPLLFYKVKGEEKYALIDKFGHDFTIFRRILGHLTESRVKTTIIFGSITLIGLLFVLPHINLFGGSRVIGAVFVSIISILLGMFSSGFMFNFESVSDITQTRNGEERGEASRVSYDKTYNTIW